jgi:hypothetical protein
MKRISPGIALELILQGLFPVTMILLAVTLIVHDYLNRGEIETAFLLSNIELWIWFGWAAIWITVVLIWGDKLK